MALENECDIVLEWFDSHREQRNRVDVNTNILCMFEEISLKDIHTILSILILENLIELKEDHLPASLAKLSITFKGIVFANTNTFVERKVSFDLEKKLLKQQSEMNSLDIKIKQSTPMLAFLAFAISLVTLITTIVNSCNEPNKADRQSDPTYPNQTINAQTIMKQATINGR